jgi:hypothetical protein
VLPEFIDQIHRDDGIAIAAHPFATCLACLWMFGYTEMDAIEVWTGPWGPDNDVALETWNGMLVQAARGRRRWLPAIGNSDAHGPDQVIGLPHNVVLADDLSAAAVIAGLNAGRNWLAESSSVNLTFTAAAGGAAAGIGERLPVAAGEQVTATLNVTGVPDGTVGFVTDEGQALTQTLPGTGTGTVTWRTTPAVSSYVRAEVRHPAAGSGLPGNMTAMTNPIFLGRG